MIKLNLFNFQRNGKIVYKTVSFAGYVGAITGVKPVRTENIFEQNNLLLLMLASVMQNMLTC